MKKVFFGEILARLSTNQGERLTNAQQLNLHFGGAETNVAVSLAQFGHETQVLTRLPDNHLSQHILKYLKAMQVDTDLIVTGGERLGTYYVEAGVGNRATQVVYDRRYSSFSEMTAAEIDYDAVLSDVDILHVTGITLALSETLRDIVEQLFKAAKQRGILISFDFNYRSKLWSQTEAGKHFKRILPYVDLCSCGELDMRHLLGYKKAPEAFNHQEKLTFYYQQLSDSYPNIKACLSTKREYMSASHNTLTGYLYANQQLYQSKTYMIDHIIDRVGGGDAFVAGILHGYVNEWELDTIVSFATAASVLKHTMFGDANLVTEAEVIEMMKADQEISR